MNRLLYLIILSGLLFVVRPVFAHPGNTDAYGCHTCRTNCSKWGLSSGEYHCHQAKTLPQPQAPIRSTFSEFGGYTSPAPAYALPKPFPIKYSPLPTPKPISVPSFTPAKTYNLPSYVPSFDYSDLDSVPVNDFAPVKKLCPTFAYNDGGSCKCSTGYVMSGESCVAADQYCKNYFGNGSDYNYVKEECQCSPGYKASQDGRSCIALDSSCMELFGDFARYDLSTKSCYCFGENIMYNGKCTAVNQACTAKYGNAIIGKKTGDGAQCVCDSGFSWNKEGTACVNSQNLQVQAPEQEVAGIKYIRTTTKVQVRQKSTSNAKGIGVTGNDYVYRVLEEQKDWIKIEFNNSEGWILRKYTKNF